MTYRPRSSVTTILANLLGRSVVSAITHTPASGPKRLVTTPPMAEALIWMPDATAAPAAGGAAACWALIGTGELTAAAITSAATPDSKTLAVLMFSSPGARAVARNAGPDWLPRLRLPLHDDLRHYSRIRRSTRIDNDSCGALSSTGEGVALAARGRRFANAVGWPGRKGVGRGRKQHAISASAPSARFDGDRRSEEHTSELQSLRHLVCRLLLAKKKFLA